MSNINLLKELKSDSNYLLLIAAAFEMIGLLLNRRLKSTDKIVQPSTESQDGKLEDKK